MAKSKPESRIFTTEISLSLKDPQKINRAVLEFHGINHSGPSYEARVFLNNKNANEKTKKTEVNGYVGSFHIFGHGGRCYGGPGHCAIPPGDISDPYDLRRSHPLTPTYRNVTITTLLKKLAKKYNKITVTIIPIAKSYDEMADMENLFQFEKLALITYNK